MEPKQKSLSHSMDKEKNLWQTYGKFIFILALAFLLVYGGWQWMKHQEDKRYEQASAAYETVLSALKARDFPKTQEAATQVIEKHKGTSYATLAALILARVEVDQQNLEAAVKHLQLAITLADKTTFESIARTRLARVLASQQKYTEALQALETKNSTEGYVALYEETKGDIYALQNEVDKAHHAYELALKAVPQGLSNTNMTAPLQLKLADLNNKEGS